MAQIDKENYDVIAATYRNPGGFAGIAPYTVNKESAQKLWALSEQMTKTKFNI